MIILASASKRRAELMKKLGIEFIVMPMGVEEVKEGLPEEVVKENALRKLEAVEGDAIAGDTIVYMDGKVLGKPKNKKEAEEILKRIRNRWHMVVSCIAVRKNGRIENEITTTLVKIREISDEEIEEYINTDLPYDKAGAYTIADKKWKMVELYVGDWENVLGMSTRVLKKLLHKG
ncbi:Maf family protein [Candidatus Micrarchaeota archaeon]|nr:Maf family protein [Candidatus Micrarchaeota archaeon]